MGKERPLTVLEKVWMMVREKEKVGAIFFHVQGDPYLRSQRLMLIEATLLASLACAASMVRTSRACVCRCALNDTRAFNVTAFMQLENTASPCLPPCEPACPGEAWALKEEEQNLTELLLTSALTVPLVFAVSHGFKWYKRPHIDSITLSGLSSDWEMRNALKDFLSATHKTQRRIMRHPAGRLLGKLLRWEASQTFDPSVATMMSSTCRIIMAPTCPSS